MKKVLTKQQKYKASLIKMGFLRREYYVHKKDEKMVKEFMRDLYVKRKAKFKHD